MSKDLIPAPCWSWEMIRKCQYIFVFPKRISTYNKLIHLSRLIAPDPLLIQWPCPLVEKGDNSTTHVNHQGWTLATDVPWQSSLNIYNVLHWNFICNFICYICCMHIWYTYIFRNLPFWLYIDFIFEKLFVFLVVYMGHQINSLRPSDTYMHQCLSYPSLVQTMAWCLAGTKSLSEPMLGCC